MDRLTSSVKKILYINITVFLLCKFYQKEIIKLFALHSFSSDYFVWYQLLTHLFIHVNFWHLISNSITLITFGPAVEIRMRSKHFIFFYVFIGVGASLLYFICTYYIARYNYQIVLDYCSNPTPEAFIDYVKQFHKFYESNYSFIYDYIHNPTNTYYIEKSKSMMQFLFNSNNSNITIGASGSIFGILTAFVMLYPNTKLYPFFIPMGVPAKHIVVIYGLYELYSGITSFDNIAHFVHLGGVIIAYIYIKLWNRNK